MWENIGPSGQMQPHPGVVQFLSPSSWASPACSKAQPCFCLCFGSWQMTMTLPLRRITLHFSQIGLTDGLTFMRLPPQTPFFGAI